MAWIYGNGHPRMAWIYGNGHPRVAWIYCRAEPMLGLPDRAKISRAQARLQTFR